MRESCQSPKRDEAHEIMKRSGCRLGDFRCLARFARDASSWSARTSVTILACVRRGARGSRRSPSMAEAGRGGGARLRGIAAEGRDAWLDALDEDRDKLDVPAVAL